MQRFNKCKDMMYMRVEREGAEIKHTWGCQEAVRYGMLKVMPLIFGSTLFHVVPICSPNGGNYNQNRVREEVNFGGSRTSHPFENHPMPSD
jgi:hypothetical protein